MNATAETPIVESTARKLGRPDVLDERRRANVLYFIGLGLGPPHGGQTGPQRPYHDRPHRGARSAVCPRSGQRRK